MQKKKMYTQVFDTLYMRKYFIFFRVLVMTTLQKYPTQTVE